MSRLLRISNSPFLCLKSSDIVRPILPKLLRKCLKVQTAGWSVYNDGPINVFVNSGSGYVNLTIPGRIYLEDEVVADACFDRLYGVQISGHSTNAWAGTIQLSTDDRLSYEPLTCIDCDGSRSTESIVVDGNSDSSDQGTSRCFGGATCTLTHGALDVVQTAAVFRSDLKDGCPDGLHLSAKECWDAVNHVDISQYSPTFDSVAAGHVPCGCVMWDRPNFPRNRLIYNNGANCGTNLMEEYVIGMMCQKVSRIVESS